MLRPAPDVLSLLKTFGLKLPIRELIFKQLLQLIVGCLNNLELINSY